MQDMANQIWILLASCVVLVQVHQEEGERCQYHITRACNVQMVNISLTTDRYLVWNAKLENIPIWQAQIYVTFVQIIQNHCPEV